MLFCVLTIPVKLPTVVVLMVIEETVTGTLILQVPRPLESKTTVAVEKGT